MADGYTTAKYTRKARDSGYDSISEGDPNYSAAQIETAQYIADLVLELRNMAKGAALYAAMIPLEYAYYEAFSVANRVTIPPEEAERLRRLSEEAAGSDAA